MSLKSKIASQFSKPGGMGATLSTALMNFINTEHYRAVRIYSPKDQGARILDVGCGNGYMLGLLSRYQGLKLYGVDISFDMVSRAERLGASVTQASVTDLPFLDGYFDCVYTINTVYFWEDYHKGFEEILRVLTKGGRFICTFYSVDFMKRLSYFDDSVRKFKPAELRDLVRKAGFKNVKVKILEKDKSFCLIGEKP